MGVVLLCSVFAQADEWIIEDDDTHITLKKNGEIAHGNNIYFNFDINNGCLINAFFFILISPNFFGKESLPKFSL